MEIKTDIAGIFKDSSSGGLINKDNSSLNAYKKQKELYRRITLLENKLNAIEQKINMLLTTSHLK